MRFLPALLLLAVLPAQVVKIANHTSMDWRGWRRVAVAQQPPHVCGWDRAGDVRYSVAGAGVVDVHLAVPAGQTRVVDLAAVPMVRSPRPQFPADPGEQFGGYSTNLTVLSLDESGAGFALVAQECSLVWYPSQPGWCHAEPAGGDPALAAQWAPELGDCAAWTAPRPWTLVWWRHLRDDELASALADSAVVAQE